MSTEVAGSLSALVTDGFVSVVGTGVKLTALTDNSDGTYLETDPGFSLVDVYRIADPSGLIPAGARIDGLRIAARLESADEDSYVDTTLVRIQSEGGAPSQSYRHLSGLARAVDLGGIEDDDGAWIASVQSLPLWAADLSDLRLYIGSTGSAAARLYDVDVVWRYNEPPTLTVDYPTGTITESKPVVAWTFADADGDTQMAYRIIVVPDAARSLVGGVLYPAGHASFNPETAETTALDVLDDPALAPVWALGSKAWGDASTRQVTTALPAGDYWCYVRAWQNDVAGFEFDTGWVAEAFTVNPDGPDAPAFTATADDATASVALEVREGAHNGTPVVTYYDIERSVDGGSWETVRNAAEAGVSLGVRLPGVSGSWVGAADDAGLDLTGDLSVRVGATLDDLTPATRQGLRSKWMTTGNQRSYLLTLETSGVLRWWWSPDGSTENFADSLDTVPAGTNAYRADFDVDNGAGGNAVTFWTSDDHGATWAQLDAIVTTAGVASIFAGSALSGIGGHSNAVFAPASGLFTFSEVRDAAGDVASLVDLTGHRFDVDPVREDNLREWSLTGDAYHEIGLDVDDHEVPPGGSVVYRARAWRDDTEQTAGDWTTLAAVDLAADEWWLKCPEAPELNTVVNVVQLDRDRPRPQMVTDPPGSSVAVVEHAGLRSYRLDAVFRTMDRAEFDALEALLESGRTLLLQSVLREQWYVQPGDSIGYSFVKAAAETGSSLPLRHLHEVTVPLTEVAAP